MSFIDFINLSIDDKINDSYNVDFGEELDNKFNSKIFNNYNHNHNYKKEICYLKNGKKITYDHRTEEYYRILRMRKLDPITNHEVDESTGFIFEYEWDPYTGERLDKDPYGPLYFDPDQLIKYFYTNRLSKLWVDPVDDINGYFEGYYDDGVGAGEEFFIPGRGFHPEWYLFRLPIIDCYLTKDHNQQIITMGPKLTESEIIEIDRKAKMKGNSYKQMFSSERPSLIEIKKLYDQAISKNPYIENANSLNDNELQQAKSDINISAVEQLKKMKG